MITVLTRIVCVVQYMCLSCSIAITGDEQLITNYRPISVPNILQSHFKILSKFSTFCGHISNYDCKMLKVAVT